MGPARFPAAGGAGAAEAPAAGAQTQLQRVPVLHSVPGFCQRVSDPAVQLVVLPAAEDGRT